jgi:hypothetical protein
MSRMTLLPPSSGSMDVEGGVQPRMYLLPKPILLLAFRP